MMTQAFYTGVSGIRTHQTAIDITSHNLANVNTVGYREYGSEFASLFEKELHSGAQSSSVQSSIGVGSRVQASAMNLSAGAYTLTERSTDLAIMGEGWFGVTDDATTLYTRAGGFYFDVNNDLVTNDGYHVLGTTAGNIEGDTLTRVTNEVNLGDVQEQVPLRFPDMLQIAPVATTQASFMMNLGVEDIARKVSTQIVTPEGERNTLELSFTKSAEQTPPNTRWDVSASIKSLDGESVYATQNGIVEFDERGALVATTLASIDNGGVAVEIDLGSGFEGIVATSGTVNGGSSVANGMIGGELVGYEINTNAEVIATFTNGMQSSVGKVAVFHFQNDQGLERVGTTSFRATSNSGEALFYKDANGNNILGTQVKNYQLENSNVKMETALTELIIYQRAFDANSKSITTADEMIQKAINMSAR